jgi:hypothetical protein
MHRRTVQSLVQHDLVAAGRAAVAGERLVDPSSSWCDVDFLPLRIEFETPGGGGGVVDVAYGSYNGGEPSRRPTGTKEALLSAAACIL